MDTLPNEVIAHIFSYIADTKGVIYILSLVDWRFYRCVQCIPSLNIPKIQNMTYMIRMHHRMRIFIKNELRTCKDNIAFNLSRYGVIVNGLLIYHHVVCIDGHYNNIRLYIRIPYEHGDKINHIVEACDISYGDYLVCKDGTWFEPGIHININHTLVKKIITDIIPQLDRYNYLAQYKYPNHPH